jgi:hypothetical protein
MNLPDDVIAIIKEYSQPITRPGWRKLRIMPSYVYHGAILYKYNRMRTRKWCRVIYNFVRDYSRDPQDKFIYSFESHIDYNHYVQLKMKR